MSACLVHCIFLLTSRASRADVVSCANKNEGEIYHSSSVANIPRQKRKCFRRGWQSLLHSKQIMEAAMLSILARGVCEIHLVESTKYRVCRFNNAEFCQARHLLQAANLPFLVTKLLLSDYFVLTNYT